MGIEQMEERMKRYTARERDDARSESNPSDGKVKAERERGRERERN